MLRASGAHSTSATVLRCCCFVMCCEINIVSGLMVLYDCAIVVVVVVVVASGLVVHCFVLPSELRVAIIRVRFQSQNGGPCAAAKFILKRMTNYFCFKSCLKLTLSYIS